MVPSDHKHLVAQLERVAYRNVQCNQQRLVGNHHRFGLQPLIRRRWNCLDHAVERIACARSS